MRRYLKKKLLKRMAQQVMMFVTRSDDPSLEPEPTW